MYPLRFIGCAVSLSGVFKRCQVCFFSDLIAFSPLWFTSTSACCLCFALGRGPTRQIALKVEGRADVHIGIRDSIVHIDIGDTRLRAIVRIATTKHQTEARTARKEGSSLLLQSYTKYVKVYQRTEKFSDRFAVRGATNGRPTSFVTFESLELVVHYATSAYSGSTVHSSTASQRGAPMSTEESATASFT